MFKAKCPIPEAEKVLLESKFRQLAPSLETLPSISGSQKEALYDSYSDTTEEYGRRLSCSWLPCCMDEEEADAFGHHVSIFMLPIGSKAELSGRDLMYTLKSTYDFEQIYGMEQSANNNDGS
ncbi:hypothetical protein TELCIR_02733 [Teladorsagia circumcincta]|uniref:Uncharacterized protein n=1 Tax=Teladorsagia circumcincta TaxID=45464 RepID=A0A2G9UYE0_TELCI|nr:hypothetical protein TELCIR_02733 [Teladorsagia circumcincta]